MKVLKFMQGQGLRHVTIANDLTEVQRKEENNMWKKVGEMNLSPTEEMMETPRQCRHHRHHRLKRRRSRSGRVGEAYTGLP